MFRNSVLFPEHGTNLGECAVQSLKCVRLVSFYHMRVKYGALVYTCQFLYFLLNWIPNLSNRPLSFSLHSIPPLMCEIDAVSELSCVQSRLLGLGIGRKDLRGIGNNTSRV